ncbi:hypothetical protein N7499_013118 [Penicillium canescens]|uniref:Histone deacetylase complex subunit SAP30 Sin3 binding domain-containing protein n=1 Tax=Penicillium canescens TaxID=5083 RepID=A0AAD6N598_PENCN|nr:uncharacterized protein N7446_000235 [Penicillium canescens]KAJ6011910.1 hypothetical protein N7522_002265 [Penicillium canescens]KAJ6030701.1 hypothetical protein N7460_010967 [Penicillium canescens]KAJ6064438.1 hypothetical protein N7499_013118 [Penicillium canescens]KAJ6077299.1 hypothetical protein N7446_000235 [Penicillium canescens]KAJ6154063.1 hypothetical protein N7485_012432 [Penicillium canescens]
MAPPRQRTTAIVDDSRSEASSGTREYKNPPKSRRPAAAAKDKASVTSAPVDQIVDDQPRLPWSDLPLEILHSYRHVHKLPTPSAFASDYSRTILSQGIGLRSPTSIAARRAQSSSSSSRNHSHTHNHGHSHRHGRNGESADSLRRIVGQDRVSKDQFALVVRRHFNSAGLSEQETIARFLYTVREERRGRQFRLRFQP